MSFLEKIETSAERRKKRKELREQAKSAKYADTPHFKMFENMYAKMAEDARMQSQHTCGILGKCESINQINICYKCGRMWN